MYKNSIMYVLVSTYSRIICVNTRISCIHVQCLMNTVIDVTIIVAISQENISHFYHLSISEFCSKMKITYQYNCSLNNVP